MKTFESTTAQDWTEVLSSLTEAPLPTPIQYTYINKPEGTITLASHFGFPLGSFKKFCDENSRKIP